MNTKEIKEVLQLMKDFDINEFELEKEGVKVRLKKTLGLGFSTQGSTPLEVRSGSAATASGPAVSPAPVPTPPVDDTDLIKSPMVGTYYSAPSPDQPIYVTPGKKVKEGDVLCIIEAMKLMNEIKAEFGGTVTEVLITNGRPVEFDQPLFKIRKS